MVMVQNGKRGNVGHAYAHKRGDRDQAVYVCMLFLCMSRWCYAESTLYQRWWYDNYNHRYFLMSIYT